MRIAVTNENNKVFQHFSQCKSFAIFHLEDEQVLYKTVLDIEKNELSSLAALVSGNNIDIILCGDICDGAKRFLGQWGIDIVSGKKGDIDQVIRDFIQDSLLEYEGQCMEGCA